MPLPKISIHYNPPTSILPAYLGDGVYAIDDGGDLRLHCEREAGPHYIIFDDDTRAALLRLLLALEPKPAPPIADADVPRSNTP